jgi:hypothetical protein
MKKRTSFVSNSSSCSFIFIGFDVTDLNIDFDDGDVYDNVERDGETLMNHSERGAPEGKVYIGKDYLTWDDCDPIDTQRLDPANLYKEELAQIKEKYDIPDNIKPEILVGIRMC